MPRKRNSRNAQLAKAITLSDSVAELIENDIVSGVYAHGQTLPSTRKLAEKYDVSQKTALVAINVLNEKGLVETRDRSGVIVRGPGRQKFEIFPSRIIWVRSEDLDSAYAAGYLLAKKTGWAFVMADDPKLGGGDQIEWHSLVRLMVLNVQLGVTIIIASTRSDSPAERAVEYFTDEAIGTDVKEWGHRIWYWPVSSPDENSVPGRDDAPEPIEPYQESGIVYQMSGPGYGVQTDHPNPEIEAEVDKYIEHILTEGQRFSDW